MLRSASPRHPAHFLASRLSPAALGTVCCVVAALGYSGTNVCLRFLTVRCDRGLILLTKEALTAACVGAWLTWKSRRYASTTRWTDAAELMVVGALTQLAASLPLLWAMAVVGLATAITVSLSASLVTSAVLGWTRLKETVSRHALIAISLLIGAVILLTFGAEGAVAPARSAERPSQAVVLLAVVVTCVSGIVYGLLSVSIRRCMRSGVSTGLVALVIPAMGVICLAPVCLWRLGAAGILATPSEDVLVMLVSGVLNVVAWLALIKGLQLTTVLHANVLTASQVAMAAVAGIFLFGEAVSATLVAGVAMTIAGMAWIDRPSGR